MSDDSRWHKRRGFLTALAVGASLFGSLLATALPARAAPSAQIGLRVHILNPPNAVTDLAAAAVGTNDGDVQLTWTAPSNENGASMSRYVVRYATNPAFNVGHAETWWSQHAANEVTVSPAHAAGVLEFTSINGLTLGVTYYFGIKAIDTDNQISAIDTRTGTANQAATKPLNTGATDPPATPANFHGIALTTSSLRWTWDPVPLAGFYTVNAFPSGALIVQTNSTSADESGLSPNTAVTRTVRAGNANGLSLAAAAQTVHTMAAVPSALAFAKVDFTNIDLSWNANGNPAGTQYRLERSDDGSNYIVAGLLTGLTYADTGLNEQTTYYYRLIAINGDGLVTAPSVVLSTVTPRKVDFLPPDTPMGLKGTLDPTGTAFTLVWEAVTRNADGSPLSDLAGYNVYRRTTLTGGASKLTPQSLASTAFADQVNNQKYYFTVRAIDASGNESPDSLFAESSPEENIIFLGDDGLSSVAMPESVNAMLRSNNNKYGVPLTIELREDPIPANSNVLRTIRLQLIRGDTKEELNDLAFSKPQAVIGIGYGLVNGNVAPGNPAAQASAAPTTITPDQLSLYWNNGVTWVKIGGTVDTAVQAVKTKSSYLGSYQLRAVGRATSLSLEQGNVYPRVFTPNNDGLNDRVFFIFENPNNVPVSGEIFDLAGRQVATLAPPAQNTGIGTTMSWDGKDSAGAVVPGGVYYYRITGEGKTFTGTVAVAR